MYQIKKYDDIEKHYQNFTEIKKQQDGLLSYKDVSNRLIHTLQAENERLKIKDKTLTDRLRNAIKPNQNEDIVNLYAKLKGSYNELERKFDKLLKENIMIHDQHTLEIMKLEESFQYDKESMTRKYNSKLDELKSQLAKIQEENKKTAEKRQDELEIFHASSAMQFDEMESSYKEQLRDATKRIQELNYTCNMLRQEIHQHKATENNCNDKNKDFIKKLEQRIKVLEKQNETHDSSDDHEISQLTIKTKFSEPVQKRSPSTEYHHKAQYQKLMNDISHTRGSGLQSKSFTTKLNLQQKKNIPKLMQVSVSNFPQNASKKRKLFNDF